MTSSSLPARKVKNTVLSFAEGVWALGFAMAGRLFRQPVSYWSSAGGQRVLVIAAHPDDEAAGCAGTLIRHKRCGDIVWIVCVTDGRRSRAWGFNPEEMARRRRQEAEAGVTVLGADRLEWLGLPEGAWSWEQLRLPLLALINQFSPHLVYAPSQIDFHPEHHKAAYGLALALSDETIGFPAPLVRVYQIHVPLTPILTNLVCDTSGVVAETAAALTAYATQADSVIRTVRQRRYAAHFYRLEKQAEEFWQMSADQYCLLHSADPGGWPANRFRGIRFRSLGDPLAYLQGMAERRQLAGLVRR